MKGTRMSRSVSHVLLVAFGCALQGCASQGVRESHIDANVPARADFDRIMRRDLEAYFAGASPRPIAALDFQLLRDGPTQSGWAYPKYYVWVVVQHGADSVQEGAARLQAMDRERFEVTHFLSRDEIASNRSGLRSVFPEPVCVRIEEKMRR
jgi:hypothetical protein